MNQKHTWMSPGTLKYYMSKLSIKIIAKSIKNKLPIPFYKGQNFSL